MALNIFKSLDQALMLLQKQWTSQLNPLLANVLTQGTALTNISLTANTPLTITTYLGRQMQGWIVTDNSVNCKIWRTQPLNSQTLTLEASEDTIINLWIY